MKREEEERGGKLTINASFLDTYRAKSALKSIELRSLYNKMAQSVSQIFQTYKINTLYLSRDHRLQVHVIILSVSDALSFFIEIYRLRVDWLLVLIQKQRKKRGSNLF